MKEPTSLTEYLALPEAEKLKLAGLPTDIPTLLNCPFCGGGARSSEYRLFGDPDRAMRHVAGCASQFGNCGWPRAEGNNPEEALRRWNTRAP